MSEVKTMIPVRGAGGGKGGGGGYIAADTLASRAYAKVVLAVSEGEVEGLANGMQDVFLGGTPIENPDGSFNFSGISFYFTPGTQGQDYVPGFSDVENETQVGLVVLNSAPLTRSISDVNANAVRVTVNLPAIYYTNTKNGDVTGSSVDIAIDIQTNGGGYVQRVYDTISGKASQNYERSYLITLNGTGPWDIRVRRVSADSTSGNPVNVVYWTSFTEIIDAKLRYPNTACAYLMVDSGQFQSIPTVGMRLRGLRIQVPSNYDPVARTYSGAWDGTFKIAWSNNPAWCFYDLLTSTRYGLGNFVAAGQVDKWALYTIGQYCDELVPDGYGGQEPRFTLNAYIQNYGQAYQLVQDMASVFRGMPFWSTGSITASQDAPGDAVALFTAANVIDGQFTYTGSSLKSRHTVALVTWYDMNNLAQPTVEYVSISDSDIAQYGEIITQVTAFGCTSRGQAHRVGRWILYSEKYEGETVAFKTGLDAAAVRPGDIIKIADPVRAGQRLGGRISVATATTITLDSPVVDQNGNPVNPIGGTLSAVGLDGSIQQGLVRQVLDGLAIQSFSRASAATYVDGSGGVVLAAANSPRKDWSTGAGLLLIEGAATNLCPNSTLFRTNFGGMALSNNAATAPDGTQTAAIAQCSTAGGAQSAAALNPADGTYTDSLWARADGSENIDVYSTWQDTSNGHHQANHITVTIGTKWQKIQLPHFAVASAAKMQISINLGAGVKCYLWGAQIEAGNAATSYIPTNGTSASRAADVAEYTTPAGAQTLILNSALAVVPNPQALWMLELAAIQAQLFRIIQITRSERNEFTITALAYNPSKYGYIEDGLALETRQITDLTQPPEAPSGLVCTESLYEYQSTIFSMASISWPAVANVNGYIFGWSRNNGNLQLVNVAGAGYDLNKTEPGTYHFVVWSVGPNGKKSSAYAELWQNLYGKTLPPSNVQGLDYGWDYNNGLVLNWEAAPDIDIAVYEVREGADWSNATVLGQTKSTTFTPGTPATGQTFWVAVLDTQGVYSAAPASVAPVLPAAAAPGVSAAFVGVNAVISWSVPASPLALDHYIVSMDGGATVFATIKGTTFSTKAVWAGTKEFSVAAVDIAGTVGAWGTASLNLLLPTVAAISDQVVDNNVLLKWSVTQGALPIDHYVVAEGDAWATATVLGQTLGTFDTIFETVAGTKTYWIAAVDAAGNQGVPVALSTYVNPPPDYVLQYNLNSTWGGAATNIAVDTNGSRVAPVDTATSFQAHFTNNSWSSPNDQVIAGFPLFIEPAPLTASYVESIDYGQLLPASNVVVVLSKTVLSGAPSFTIDIAVSADNSTWTTYSNTTNVYVANFRYAKITVNISGTAGLDILRLDNLNIKYQVKQKMDSGTVACLSTDTNGSPASFNISFLDVTSITVTPSGTTPCFAIYDFAGGAAPTGFTIMLFDTAGNRTSGNVSWTARGV